MPRRTLALTTLPRKLWGRTVQLARRLPGVANRELRHYLALEARLLHLPAPETAQPAFPWALPPAPVIREALATGPDYHCIDLRSLGRDDPALLSRHGLEPEHIIANRGLIPESHLPPERIARRRRLGLDPDTDGTAFQLEALDQAAVEAVCPVTGRLRRAIHGLLAAQNQPIFYWFPANGEAPAMLLAAGREGRGWIKLYLLLPALRTALLLADATRWHGRDEIDELRAHLLAEHRAVDAYLRRTDPPRPWVLLDNRQFAHHLWNALSGLERLAAGCKGGDIAPPAGLVVCAEPWGPPEALFPELSAAGIPVERAAFPAPIRAAQREHRLLLRVGGTRISEALLARVHRLAAQRVPVAVIDAAAALRRDRRPILWATLRMENRTWVSQVQGLIAIGRRLAAEYPNAALVIDGFSVPYGPANAPDAGHARLIAAEQRAATTIASALAGVLPVVSLVGRPLFETVVFTTVADCSLAHQGSLQHKIGWLGNCHGVVHANRTVLTTPMLWEPAFNARIHQTPPIYLDPALVSDVPGAKRVAKNRWLEDLDNYALDPDAAYAVLAPLLAEAGRSGVD